MDFIGQVIAWFADPQNWEGPNGIPTRLAQHVGMSAAALGISVAIALPLGIVLGHTGKGGNIAINISNVGRAVPTFAVLSLLALGPLGLSTASTIVALVLFGIPPILTNTYVGMREVDREVVEASVGMGMRGDQVVRRVEVPLAVPMLMSGVRLAAVQIVATATIAALVAGGGLGRIITSGFSRQDNAQVVAGALLVAALALTVELFMEWLQRRLDPVRRVRESAPPVAPVLDADLPESPPG